MTGEWWSSLSHSQQIATILAIPVLLFLMDFLVKNGFKLSTVSAGGDLCLAALGLDISQTFIAIAGSAHNTTLPSLLLLMALVHLVLWLSALRLAAYSAVSTGGHYTQETFPLAGSCFLGTFAFSTSLGTILLVMTG